MNNIEKLYKLLDSIPVTKENKEVIEEIKIAIEEKDFTTAIKKINELNNKEEKTSNEEIVEETKVNKTILEDSKDIERIYPKELSDLKLEKIFIGMLLNDPKAIGMYYFLYDECFFEDKEMLNIYKSILFTEGEAYASEAAKAKYNFSKDSKEVYDLKYEIKTAVKKEKNNFEDVYVKLKKLFVLRKAYNAMPLKEMQDKIIEIAHYELYEKMSAEEVADAVKQVNDTVKFKRAVISENLSNFLITGDNTLTNGLSLPFPILTSVFKGIRKGETSAFAMPSNAGKSRFTINLAAYVSFIHKKKVLIISNEMSEEKVRLCLITTILNNPEIQGLHGQKISKTEGELLEFKFRPDNLKGVKVDKDGFVIKEEKETQKHFAKRLSEISTEFNQTIAATDWLNKQMNNSIYFINITDHTNDELKKVIMNYYYKEKIEYIFYDTLKTDTANIGNGEEIKKTATILSNLAQNFNIYIGSTLQLTESNTLPINLNINDLAVSRTVKEVLDTLCLFKQINRENLGDYEYSLEEVDTKFYPLKKYEDPDVRYYACVVDKNRAGAKPRLVFKLNLAYNSWVELGYLRLKQ